MWKEFWNTHAKGGVISLIMVIGFVAGILSLPTTVIVPFFVITALSLLSVLLYLAYKLGTASRAQSTTDPRESSSIDANNIAECCRYLRYGHQISYDAALVNQLLRAQWLREHHSQWQVTNINADKQFLFLAGSSSDVIEGLIFSIIKVGAGISCRYTLTAADIADREIRLQPTSLSIRATDEAKSFLIDVVDPTPEDVGRTFEVERLLAGALNALGQK